MHTHPGRSLLVLAGLVCIGLVFGDATAHVQERRNAFADSMEAFQVRVRTYLELRSRVARSVPEVKETSDPAGVSAREQALGEAIAKARAGAKAGEVFGDLAPHLRRILARDWTTRSVADRKALFEEVPPGLALAVNEPYPKTIPLVSSPARLLAQLPTLPDTLEFRLIYRRLLLRDRDANLVIDVLTTAPPPTGR